ncbi:MAG: hypothetical protein CMJ80_17260 [Planctomycetaceae bacterium]|nr:hypothetical protein [Planctomycetaceae bacterium]
MDGYEPIRNCWQRKTPHGFSKVTIFATLCDRQDALVSSHSAHFWTSEWQDPQFVTRALQLGRSEVIAIVLPLRVTAAKNSKTTVRWHLP